MTSTRPFYRTVLQVEVMVGNERIDAATAATMLIRSGSDPGFFRLDADGNDDNNEE